MTANNDSQVALEANNAKRVAQQNNKNHDIQTEEIEQKVKDIIAATLRIHDYQSASTISSNSRLVDDLSADSLDIVEIILALEESFNCSITDEEASKMSTVSDIVNYIASSLRVES